MSPKPSLFIGSSVEGLEVAYALQEALDYDCEPTVWTQNVFQPTRAALGDLLGATRRFDRALFVFTPDDVTVLRGSAKPTVRDNVLFELGLFVGALGPERTTFIRPRDAELHLPTDLLGIEPLTYVSGRVDGNLLAALGPAVNRLRRSLREDVADGGRKPDRIGARDSAATLVERWAGGEFTAERALLRRGIPLHAMDDEDGAATRALRKVFYFLDSVADAVLGGDLSEAEVRAALEPAMTSVWDRAYTYFPAPNHADDAWIPLPRLGELVTKWRG